MMRKFTVYIYIFYKTRLTTAALLKDFNSLFAGLPENYKIQKPGNNSGFLK